MVRSGLMWKRKTWAAAAMLFASAAPAAALEVVYVVRHAQKQDPWNGDDRLRPLSPKGVICAGRLAEKLAGAGIAAVYSTETVRTLATGTAVSGAESEAGIFGDDASASPSSEWVRSVLLAHRGHRAILVVGHSNTVDDLVLSFRPDTRACQEELKLADIPDAQYGDVWRLDLTVKEDCRGVTRESLGEADGVDCTTP